jgi:hypothetical protein
VCCSSPPQASLTQRCDLALAATGELLRDDVSAAYRVTEPIPDGCCGDEREPRVAAPAGGAMASEGHRDRFAAGRFAPVPLIAFPDRACLRVHVAFVAAGFGGCVFSVVVLAASASV